MWNQCKLILCYKNNRLNKLKNLSQFKNKSLRKSSFKHLEYMDLLNEIYNQIEGNYIIIKINMIK